MKKFLLIISVVFIYTSCGSVKKTKQSVNSGNYESAIRFSINKLKRNKDKKRNQPYVLILQEAFEKISKRDLKRIKFLKKEGNSESLEEIYTIYLDLDARQELIRPILPLPILKKGKNQPKGGQVAFFDFKDYSTKIIASKDSLSLHLYNKSKILFNSENKEDLRSVYYDLEYLDEINPNYKDVRSLMNDIHSRGVDFVYVSMKNETQQIIPKRLERELLDFDTYGLDDIWTVFHSRKNIDITYDFGLELNLQSIEISPEQIRERQTIVEKQIKEGYKHLIDEDGNEVKDSLGNTIEVDNFITVRGELFQTIQLKSTRIVGKVTAFDFKTQQNIHVFPIVSEFVFEYAFADYHGDERALDQFHIDLVGLSSVPFPSNEQMVYDTGTDLKEQLKQILINTGFRE